MRVKSLRSGGWRMVTFALAAILLLSACAPKNANATPTLSVQAIYTAAHETLLAEQATQLALVPPTSTPPPPTPFPTLAQPSPLPTLLFASPTPGGGGNTGACDSAAFVGETVPDGTTIDPGKTFTKTWTLMNNGTCTWSTGYSFVFKSGDQMGGVNTPLGSSVGPGSSITISVKLTAPTASGTYKGTWQMQNASSQAFGVAPWVLIKVGVGPTATVGTPPTPQPACNPNCTITITSDRDDFTVTISNNKSGNTECVVPTGTKSCSFTVPLHWDGKVTLSKGTYTFDGSPYTFTNVIASTTVFFHAH